MKKFSRKFSDESLEELQNKIDLEEVVKSLGVTCFQNLDSLGRCPICQHFECFAMEKQLCKKCFCFHCGFKGSAIDLLMAKKLISFKEAVLELAKMFNVKMEYSIFEAKTNHSNRNRILEILDELQELI